MERLDLDISLFRRTRLNGHLLCFELHMELYYRMLGILLLLQIRNLTL